MKFKNFLMGGMIAALAAFFVVGCNENPDDPGGGDGDDVAAVTNLGAVSLSSTSVGLAWDASTTTGATYKVEWMDGSTSVGSKDVSTTSTTIDDLTAGKAYVFTVTAVDADDNESDAVSVTWAPAARYNNDADNQTLEIALYEFESDNGSGLILDPAQGGPSTESMSASNDDIDKVQFAFFVNNDGTFAFGPSHGFATSIFQAAGSTDANVVISDQAYTTTGLDDWYMNAPLTSLVTNKTTPFTLQQERTDGTGYAFVVRTGTSAANYRYARVFLKPGGNGKIVRGTAPNRFISLAISYQNTAGVPYAKGN